MRGSLCSRSDGDRPGTCQGIRKHPLGRVCLNFFTALNANNHLIRNLFISGKDNFFCYKLEKMYIRLQS